MGRFYALIKIDKLVRDIPIEASTYLEAFQISSSFLSAYVMDYVINIRKGEVVDIDKEFDECKHFFRIYANPVEKDQMKDILEETIKAKELIDKFWNAN